MRRALCLVAAVAGLSLFNFVQLLAQNGTISGVVLDELTSEAIIGANVVIAGTTTGASTDLDGKFSIQDLRPGDYDLVVSYVSYKPHNIPAVSVEAARITNIKIELKEDVSELEGVTVVGQREMSADAVLLRSLRESSQIVTGISAEIIAKTQDSDASEIVRRIPGVTVMGDKFIVIRGLSQRYNVATLHNAYAPSMEADVRSFAFDIVPSNQIDQILIFKSPSADLPGDFGGGVVKVNTRNLPPENSLTLGYSTAFRTNTHLRTFLNPEMGPGSALGFNTGFNDLPRGFPSDIRNVQNNESLVTASGRALVNSWVPSQNNGFLDQSFSLTGSFRVDPGKKFQLGNITSFTYGASKAAYPVNRNDFNEYDFINDESRVIYEFFDSQYNQNYRMGLVHNWGAQIGANHTLNFKNLFNQVSTYQYINRLGKDFEFNYYPDNHSFQQVFRGLYSGQLTGDHSLNRDNTKISWVAGYGISYRDMPDYRRYRMNIVNPEDDDGTRSIYVPFGAAQTYFLGRFYSDMDERNITGGFNIEQAIVFSASSRFRPVVKAGVFWENKTREFVARNIGYVRSNSSIFNTDLQLLPIDQFFAPENINPTTGIRIDEQTNPNDQYSAANNLMAYYGQMTLPITLKLNAVLGVRYEDNVQELNSALLGGEIVDREYPVARVLPSVNISYNFTPKMLVRLAYGETLNRPEFREIAPFGFFDFDFNLVKVGNPDLKVARIQNLDLRWELYPSPTEIVNIGVFYKKFTDPIETLFVPGSGTGGAKTFTFGNAESATSLGVEVDLRKSLDGLTGSAFIDNWSVLFNAAFIRSNVQLGGTGTGRDSDDRPLYGQSPYIVNTGLFYADLPRKLQVSILYNIIGPRLFIIGFDNYPDIWEMPRNILDLSVTKGFGERLELKFGVSDLINQETLYLQDARQSGSLDRKTDQVIQRFFPGAVYSLGLNFKVF